MNQASTPQSKSQQNFARFGQTLLMVALSLLSVPTLVSPQQTVKAVEVEVNQVATSNNWHGASFPVENFQTYSSAFGYRRSATGGSKTEFHRGLDLVAPQGSYIRNWWTGKVVKVSGQTGCGTHIVIQSGDWEHVYCHMKGHVEVQGGNRYLIDREGGIQIWEGQNVSAGTRIGRVGMTGRTTGPHLHWGLKYANNYVDPALVLRAMYAQQTTSTQSSTGSQQWSVGSSWRTAWSQVFKDNKQPPKVVSRQKSAIEMLQSSAAGSWQQSSQPTATIDY